MFVSALASGNRMKWRLPLLALNRSGAADLDVCLLSLSRRDGLNWPILASIRGGHPLRAAQDSYRLAALVRFISSPQFFS
jgi:hypothetical protein